jgi:class 3 adenylate cyclase/tetratricopeptide (TPR) repeat protein
MATPRLLAILWADLVESTGTVAKLGPEAGEAWRQRFITAMREALVASRGREVQHTGDGLFAAFDSASDAVACAVGLQQRIAQASQRRDAEAPAAARVAVSAGEAREDAEGVHGLVVVEAARLCAAAKPGQILASALVEALAAGGPHRFASVGDLTLKGLPALVAAREIGWERAAAPIPLSPRLAELARGTFVGRAPERAQLETVLAAARRGDRQIALVAGEPGIGKTRLAAELARDAHAAGAIVLDGRCDEDLGAPFQPWIQALAHFASLAPDDELRALVAEEAIHALPLVPELRRRLPDLAVPADGELEGERWRLFEAVDALLAGASRGSPLVILLDDLHWADAPSLALLRHLARSPRPAALLVLVTYRETDLVRTHPLAEALADLRREPHVARVLLRGLDHADLGALVAARAQHDAPEAFVRALHAETEGNPFFAHEVIRHLVESGALRREGDRWIGTRPLAELGIPEGVRDVIGRRLSRLSETANEALRAASVIGREFELPELEAASRIARDALLDAIDEAGRARITSEVPGAPGRFAFAHALIRSTLYDELGSAQRMRLHWRVGEALERRHAHDLDPHASAIAQHLAEGVLAGDALRAANASLRAGASAAALAAHEDAHAHFARAVALLDQAGIDEAELRHVAWTGSARALFFLGDQVRYLDAFFEAYRIAERNRWTERMASSALGVTSYLVMDPAHYARVLEPLEVALAALGPCDRPERAVLLGRRALIANFSDADYERTAAELAEAEAIARRCGDADAQLVVERYRTFLLSGSPQPAELERLARKSYEAELASGDTFTASLRLFQVAGSAAARGDRTAVDLVLTEEFPRLVQRTASRSAQQNILVMRGALELASGRFDEAKQIIAEARDMWGGNFQSSLLFRAQLQAARLEQGRHAQVAEVLARFVKSAPRWLQYQRAVLASTLAELGRMDELRRELVAFDTLRLQPRGWSWPLALRHLPETCALLGDAQRAADLVPQLEPYKGQLLVTYSGTVIEGSADRARGQVLATLGRLDEAIGCYESGLALEEAFGAPALAARTRYWLARALAMRGETARAQAEAEASRDAARGFGMVLLADHAERVVAELTVR